MKNDTRHILVFNVNWIGDVIFTSPVFKALKKQYPSARIVCLAVPRVRGILESMPGLDGMIEYDERGRGRGLWGKIRLIRQLRRERFDMALILHRSWTRALLIFLAGIPIRIGYDTKKRGMFLTHPVELPPPGWHRSDFYLHLVRANGIDVQDTSCELRVDQRMAEYWQRRLSGMGVDGTRPLIVVHVGANWDLKRWPKTYFTDLIRRLRSELDADVLIPGAGRDRSLAEAIVPADVPGVHVLAGETDLKQLIALMARADLVISADSGPMHVAHCVGTRVIALFGPTRPEITGPRGKGEAVILQEDLPCNRAPCYNLDCPDNKCMQAVTVDAVMQAVRGLGFRTMKDSH